MWIIPWGYLEGLQKQIDPALEVARKWRLSGNVKKCAVVACDDSKVEEVYFKWKREDEEPPRVWKYVKDWMKG